MKSLYTEQETRAMMEKLALAFAKALPQRSESLLVSEWAERKRVLPQGLSSRPGPFRFAESEPLREIADCLSESSPVREIALMKGAQLGGTVAVIENFLGYVIDCCPGPMMTITGDKDMADLWMEKRVDPMIQSCGLQHKIFAQVQKAHGKKTGDTKDSKEFPGGFLLSYGPNSGSKLRSNAIKYLLLDEEDAYPQQVGTEGDPISLAIRRTDTFESSRKILHISTPLIRGFSRIEQAFLDGDQRYYQVPCKHCGEFQALTWKQLRYDQDETKRLIWSSVRYECAHCAGEWRNADKAWFLPRGKWVPTAEPKKRGMRSYHLSSLYAAPGTRSWESIAEEWIASADDVKRMKTFVNTVLGESFEERGEAPKWERIMLRLRGAYDAGDPPPDSRILALTLGVDVQKDRIECELVGWGENKRSWSLGYQVFRGDTENLTSPTWSCLRILINSQHLGKNIGLVLIDAGYRTSTVYQFCEETQGIITMPVMSEPYNSQTKNLFTLRKVPGYAIERVNIQSGQLKTEVYSYLNRDMEGDQVPFGYCQFPQDYQEEYFKQLTAESLIHTTNRAGSSRYEWKKSRERNEALDCRVYSLAALYVLAAIVQGELSPDEPIAWGDFWAMLKTT